MNNEIITNDGARAKKPYQQPLLRLYGGIRNLTETTTTMGANPDTRGFFMDNRTH